MTLGSKFVDADGIRLHYLEWPGDGPTALLLHGRGLCAQVWTPTAEALSSRFRVLAMDLRGHGDSTVTTSGALAEMTGDIIAVMAGLGIERPVLIGHSLGGAAALNIGQYDDRVKASINLDGYFYV